MSTLVQGPRAPGHPAEAHAHAWAFPLAIAMVCLSLLAGVGQVVESAVAGTPVALRVSERSIPLSVEDEAANLRAGVIAADFVEPPPASVDAISL